MQYIASQAFVHKRVYRYFEYGDDLLMSYKSKKVLLSLAAISIIIASIGFVLMTTFTHKLPVLNSRMSATDYYTPGSDPWGTAFDSSGRVWVALPGCDFAPSCPTSTPPGKIALFNPVTHNWDCDGLPPQWIWSTALRSSRSQRKSLVHDASHKYYRRL